MSTEGQLGAEARVRLSAVVDRTLELTPLKAAATRAIQMAEDEQATAMDLATVIGSDPALSAKLLRLSNSAYYGYSRQVGNVREAVILLGMRTVRSVALSTAVIEAFAGLDSTPEFALDLFWAHSVCVGLVAESLAKLTGAARPEDAFTAGVIHDMGMLALMRCEPLLFAEAHRAVTSERRAITEAERQTFGFTHGDVGGLLAERWQFPASLVATIAQHHHAIPDGSPAGLSWCVAAADIACDGLGLAAGHDFVRGPLRPPPVPLPPRFAAALSQMGGVRAIEAKAQAFLHEVSAAAARWYVQPDEQLPDAPHEGNWPSPAI